MRLTTQAHHWLAPVLHPGGRALDATAGNGWDALFLAKELAPGGTLWVVDLQETALQTTAERLQEWEAVLSLRLLQGHHGDLADLLTTAGLRQDGKGILLDAAIFNLGYLPGGKVEIITQADSTIRALNVVSSLLRPGGRLAVVAYPGHPGGGEEAAAVEAWAEAKIAGGSFFEQAKKTPPGSSPIHAPRGFFLERI